MGAEEGQRESQGDGPRRSNLEVWVPVPREMSTCRCPELSNLRQDYVLESLQALCLEAEYISSILQVRKLRLRENKVIQLLW